jgi:FkbM family methyltransferase
VAFEPDVRNAAFLRRHIAVNRLTNVDVFEAAVSNRRGAEYFAKGTGSGTGRLSDDGDCEVQVVRLDDVAQRCPAPTHMKIDVEGAELRVLEGALSILAGARPTLFLSLHGDDVRAGCQRLLRGLDYQLEPISRDPRHADEVLCLPR